MLIPNHCSKATEGVKIKARRTESNLANIYRRMLCLIRERSNNHAQGEKNNE